MGAYSVGADCVIVMLEPGQAAAKNRWLHQLGLPLATPIVFCRGKSDLRDEASGPGVDCEISVRNGDRQKMISNQHSSSKNPRRLLMQSADDFDLQLAFFAETAISELFLGFNHMDEQWRPISDEIRGKMISDCSAYYIDLYDTNDPAEWPAYEREHLDFLRTFTYDTIITRLGCKLQHCFTQWLEPRQCEHAAKEYVVMDNHGNCAFTVRALLTGVVLATGELSWIPNDMFGCDLEYNPSTGGFLVKNLTE